MEKTPPPLGESNLFLFHIYCRVELKATSTRARTFSLDEVTEKATHAVFKAYYFGSSVSSIYSVAIKAEVSVN